MRKLLTGKDEDNPEEVTPAKIFTLKRTLRVYFTMPKCKDDVGKPI